MKVSSITINNIRGIDSLEIKPGSLTVVRGPNGTGKSSVIDALRAVFEGGHNPDLIRAGEEKAEVILELDTGAKIRRLITPNASSVQVWTPDGTPVRKPQAFIETLASGFGLDPVSFIHPRKKSDRVEFLMRVMPIEFSKSELPTAAVTDNTFDTLTLDQVDTLRQRIYDDRTAKNTIARDAKGAVADLEKALPDDDGTDWSAQVVANESKIEEIRAAAEEEKAKIRQEFDNSVAEARATFERTVADMRKLFEQDVADIDAQAAPVLQELSTRKAEAAARAQEQTRLVHLRRQIEEARAKAKANEEASSTLTQALKSIDELKTKKLAELPIPDVQMRAGEVYVGDLKFDQLNLAQRYMRAFQFAALAPGDLGLMISDDAEHLVGSEWETFCAAAKDSGFQVVVARAELGAGLEVKTVE